MIYPTEHTLKYGQANIVYQFSCTDRKTLAIHVHPNTLVTVEVPLGSDPSDIEKLLHMRAAWILRQQRNFRRFSYDLPPRQYVSGETHRYLGKQYQLKVLQSEYGEEYVKMDREHILVYSCAKYDQAKVKELLTSWYRQRATEVFSERLSVWYPRFERYQLRRPRIYVRQMRSRWGSCTTKGKMTLNLKLIQVPKTFIDYVIVHELCHLNVHNHSSEFYTLMSRIMPDWKGHREKLNSFEF